MRKCLQPLVGGRYPDVRQSFGRSFYDFLIRETLDEELAQLSGP